MKIPNMSRVKIRKCRNWNSFLFDKFLAESYLIDSIEFSSRLIEMFYIEAEEG
jgi:hypothetical protein